MSIMVNKQFASGFGSALLLLGILAVGVRAARWLAGRDLVVAFTELLTKPMLSIMDVLPVLIVLLILWVVYQWMVIGPVSR